jgi:hypothetical protein
VGAAWIFRHLNQLGSCCAKGLQVKQALVLAAALMSKILAGVIF